MARHSSSILALSWLRVIEYLASLPQLDLSILQGLIQSLPDLPIDSSTKTKEMLALRCLEHLFGYGNDDEAGAHSPSSESITPHFSQTCEDVLSSIVQKTSISDLKMDAPELLKWNIRPFLARKRANLPKFSLEQLKDEILEGIHPYATSKISGIVQRNDEYDKIPVDHDSCNSPVDNSILFPIGSKNGMEEGGSHVTNLSPCKSSGSDLNNIGSAGGYQETQVSGQDDHLHPTPVDHDGCNPLDNSMLFPIESKNGMQEGGSHVTNLLPCKCTGSDLSNINSAGNYQGKHDDHLHVNFKRLKLGASLESQSAVQVSISPHSNSEKVQQVTSGGQHQQFISVDDASDDDRRELNVDPSVQIYHRDYIGEAKNNVEQSNHPKLSSASLNTSCRETSLQQVGVLEHLHEEGTSGDVNPYSPKVIPARMRSHFLRSQHGHDFVIEQKLCVKCSKADQVLICSTVQCRLAVHEKCLNCPPRFDEIGNFHCPFCVYSQLIREYDQAKEEMALAKEELRLFLNRSKILGHHAGKKDDT